MIMSIISGRSAFPNLVKKFRFKNLKPYAQTHKSLPSAVTNRKQIQQRKIQSQLAPFRRKQEKAQKQKEAEKMSTLSNTNDNESKTAIKLSSAQPWKMTDDPQLFQIEYGRHVRRLIISAYDCQNSIRLYDKLMLDLQTFLVKLQPIATLERLGIKNAFGVL